MSTSMDANVEIKIELKNISKAFDGVDVLKDVSMNVRKGEVVSLLGASGMGKTTLFNIMAGLISADQGTFDVNGELCYMQQSDLLLEYLTVEDNVSLPLRIQGKKKSEARAEAIEYLPIFGLEGTEKLYPQQLSGGMRQRAALLRTFLQSGDVMLLDEPFSALDMFTKREMYAWYSEISRKYELTTLFITHDVDEAIVLSDRIYVLTGKALRPEEIVIDRELLDGVEAGVEVEAVTDAEGEVRNRAEAVRIEEVTRAEFVLSDRFMEYKREVEECFIL